MPKPTDSDRPDNEPEQWPEPQLVVAPADPASGIEVELRRIRHAFIAMYVLLVVAVVVAALFVAATNRTAAERDRATEVKCLYLDDC